MSPVSLRTAADACPTGANAAQRLTVVMRAWRIIRLAALLLAFAAFACTLAPLVRPAKRRCLLRAWAKCVLGVLGVRLMYQTTAARSAGPALLVANHVSSIDALLITALFPACFVAKSQLGATAWLRRPLAGVGTIFIDRSRRAQVLHALASIHQALEANETVALFPEATVGAAGKPGRFNSALLQPASEGVPLYVIALRLSRSDGLALPEADFPLRQSFPASFWRLAGVPTMLAHATVLGPFHLTRFTRKEIATMARETIDRALAAADVERKT
jgi:1-acyl-sn-glycerol-3-phosphate acyltransferase